jgi:uncharacterized Zn-binding protein involved in type VI secretion
MPQVVRKGDICTGHGCFPSRANIQGSSNVFINGIPVHRVGDAWPVHCCDSSCHPGVLAQGSPNVFVNGKQLGRVGDSINCGSKCASGSNNVFCN